MGRLSQAARLCYLQPVQLEGTYANNFAIPITGKYLGNSGNKHQLGYHVVTPFLMDGGTIAFVNRGWVKIEELAMLDVYMKVTKCGVRTPT